jgi:16S rRNA C967 or C1407 C5-methylase (RsmB/RsmF family)/NOL1/NOP2/fmu family ribosome biogenesis protein
VQLPEELLESLKRIESFDKEAFEKIHVRGEQVTSIRINPDKFSIENLKFKIENKVPWTRYGVYLAQRPSFTFDPLFHAGCYYVQEASSMFLEQALKQTVDLSKPVKILDLCAAPGGKSTHIQSLISKDSLLVSNEVIQSRVSILKDNIIKWGSENVVVTRNDPGDFSRLENYFDVIVIDAPCSGSGLFRREPEAIEEWSLNNVKLCSLRQQRIVADILPALKKEGILIYCTCSYSKEEDEDICKWMTDIFSIENCKLKIESDWAIAESSAGYRFWPNKLKGEGFFLACFKKADGYGYFNQKIKNKPELLNKKDSAVIEQWINKNSFQFIRRNEAIHAVSEKLLPDIHFLSNHLRVIYAGVAVGQIIRDKFIPEHALAMSNLLKDSVPSVELDHDTAIQYLKKKEIQIKTTVTGWQLVQFEGHKLGWVNVLPNRINNYYPKELRILKES